MTEKVVDQSIEIDADADTVWQAITDGEEIKRWFTLDARTRPGSGGGIWLSFGEGMEWESPIEVWEPQKHLRTVDTMPGDPPKRLAVDYTIESSGGKTILRLVHSGFGKDEWDDELDTLNSGWASFLENLKHYVERHRGQPREVAYFRHPPVEITRSEAFIRTLHLLGFKAEQQLAVGDRYSVTSEAGDHFEGVIKIAAAPIHLTMSVENWNDGWMMIEMEPGKNRTRPAIWMSLYGDARKDAPMLQEHFRDLLMRAFTPSA